MKIIATFLDHVCSILFGLSIIELDGNIFNRKPLDLIDLIVKTMVSGEVVPFNQSRIFGPQFAAL